MPAPTARCRFRWRACAACALLFEIAHQQRFGFISAEKDIEIEAIEVEAEGGGEPVIEPEISVETTAPARRHATTRFFTLGGWHEAPIFLRGALAPGHAIEGPALIIEDHQTVVVEPEWQAQVTTRNQLLLTRIAKKKAARVGKEADPVMVEVFNNLFVSIAEQMGYALQNTARSVNIKERLDFSCAIFDAKGAADRQRAAYPGASRLDGPQRGDGARANWATTSSRATSTC